MSHRSCEQRFKLAFDKRRQYPGKKGAILAKKWLADHASSAHCFYYENDTSTFTRPVAVASRFFSHCAEPVPGVALVFVVCGAAGATVCRYSLSMGIYRQPQSSSLHPHGDVAPRRQGARRRWPLAAALSRARNFTIQRRELGPSLVASIPLGDTTRRRCSPMAGYWSQGVPSNSQARNFTIRRPGVGLSPAASILAAWSIPQPCLPMVGCSSQVAKPKPVPGARNFTIQPRELGPSQAASILIRGKARRRCSLMAGCSSQVVACKSLTGARNSTIQPRELGPSQAASILVGSPHGDVAPRWQSAGRRWS